LDKSFHSTEPTLYLYSRVSTDRQTKDGKMGVYRQTESEIVAKVITRFSGMPVIYLTDYYSAYKGDNISKGELGIFIQNCDAGLIAAGSVIAMEELDRFTRLSLSKAQSLVLRVLEADVKIFAWNKTRTFTKDNLMSAFEIVLELQGAYLHSKKISRRVTETALDKVKLILKTKRKSKEPCPAVGGYGHTKWWIDISSGFVEPHKYYWPIAEEMIQLILGGMGHMKMREYLTERYDAPRTAHNENKTGWGENITRVFHSSEALLGVKKFNFKETIDSNGDKIIDSNGNEIVVNNEYVINDYYPPLCSIETFEEMAAVKQRNRTNKKVDGEENCTGIFTGLDICRCGFCGLTINTFRSKAEDPVKMAFRYKCAGKYSANCKSATVDSKIIETAIIKMIGVAITQPAPEINNEDKFELQQALKDVTQKMRNTVDGITQMGGSVALTEALKKQESQKVKIEAKLEVIYLKSNVKIDIENPKNYINEIPPIILDWTKNEARYELKEQLRKLVKSITVKLTNKLCDLKIELKNGTVIQASVIRLKYLLYRNKDMYHKSEDHGGLSTLWFAEKWYGIDRNGDDYNLMSCEYMERYSTYHQNKFNKAYVELISKMIKNKGIMIQ